MKIGDYVRTKKGIIGKIKAIDNQTELEDLYLVKRKWYYKEDIIKSSPNIIDLIELGDYVNGSKVELIQNYAITKKGKYLIRNAEEDITDDKQDKIKSIITKEQFESMEYKIGE